MKNLLTLLKEEYIQKSEGADGLLLLSSMNALDFIQRGRRLGLRLMGVEGFKKMPSGAIQPQQEFSNDIADTILDQEEFVARTLELVGKGDREGLLFEVVFDP